MSNMTGEQKFKQQQEELDKDIDSRMKSKDLPDVNIMVAGITGAGKSTLINAVFGSEMAKTGAGRPVTDHIEEYQDKNIPIHIWDTVGLELDYEKTKKSIESIKKIIASKAPSNDPYDRIHAIWYCINSGSNRYQGAELKFIKELYSIKVPFIIVLTQCSGDEDEINAFEAKIREINNSMEMNDIRIVQVLALPVKYRGMANPIPAFGLKELVEVTLAYLPAFIKRGFVAAQRVSQSEKRRECEEIICEAVRKAENGFWDKVPIVNVFLTDKNIINMFKKLGEMYNTVLTEEAIKKLINGSNVDFKNNFFGLISPIDMGYSKKITELLNQKKEDGFSVSIYDVEKNNRAARMIAFYGYTFIDSIEELWKEYTEEDLKDIDKTINELIDIINRKLGEKKFKFGG